MSNGLVSSGADDGARGVDRLDAQGTERAPVSPVTIAYHIALFH